MAKDKNSFVLYSDLITRIEHLTTEEKGLLFQHLLEYVNDLNPVLEDRVLIGVWKPIEQQLKRDLKKFEQTKEERSLSGKLGNLKRYNKDLYDDYKANKITLKEALTTASNRKTSHSDTNLAVNDSVNVNVSVNEIIDKSITYTEKDFLENWSKCRKHYLNKVTHISKLYELEKADFNKALKEFTKEQINTALHGLFKQEVKNISSMYLRPKHFLENVSKYYNAEINKDYTLYGKDEGKNKKGGL